MTSYRFVKRPTFILLLSCLSLHVVSLCDLRPCFFQRPLPRGSSSQVCCASSSARTGSVGAKPRGFGTASIPTKTKKVSPVLDAIDVAGLVNDNLRLAWEPAHQVTEALNLRGADLANTISKRGLTSSQAALCIEMCRTALAHDPDPTLWLCGTRTKSSDFLFSDESAVLPSLLGSRNRVARKLQAADMCAIAAVALYDSLSALLGSGMQIHVEGLEGSVSHIRLQDATPPGRYALAAFGPDPRQPLELYYTNPVMLLADGTPRRLSNPLAMHTLLEVAVSSPGGQSGRVWLDSTAEQYDRFSPRAGFGYAFAVRDLSSAGHAILQDDVDLEVRRLQVENAYPGSSQGITRIVKAVCEAASSMGSYVRKRPD